MRPSNCVRLYTIIPATLAFVGLFAIGNAPIDAKEKSRERTRRTASESGPKFIRPSAIADDDDATFDARDSDLQETRGTSGAAAGTTPAAEPGMLPATAPLQVVPSLALPGTTTVCNCDYWIVSSRKCSSFSATATGNCCLSFFHRTSDQCIDPVPREAFLASLDPSRPVCFVVHGSYNWWHDVVKESRLIHRWIRSGAPDRRVQVVFFTWSSDGYMPFLFPVDLAILGRKSAKHGLYLASLIGQMPPEQPVSLLGHSHGARTTTAAMHLLGGGAVDGQTLPPGYSSPQRLRAVMLAAALDHHWLNPGERYGQALCPAERVLLMKNHLDVTLAVYPLRKVISPRSLGRDGLGWSDRYALESQGSKVVELDASAFARWGHSFANFYEHPELAQAIVPYVYFQEDQPTVIGPAPMSLQPVPKTPTPARHESPGEPRGNPVKLRIER